MTDPTTTTTTEVALARALLALQGEVERLREERAASPAVVVTQGRGFTDMMLRCERLENEVMELHAEVERLLEQAESTNFQREQERAAVVAFLREGDTVCMQCGDRATLDLAYRIECGEHRKEKS